MLIFTEHILSSICHCIYGWLIKVICGNYETEYWIATDITSSLFRFCGENRPLADELLLDAVEEVVVLVVVNSSRRCLRCLPGQRLEAHEEERLDEASSIRLIFRHYHNDAVHLQLLLGELQKRDEGLLGAGRRKVLR